MTGSPSSVRPPDLAKVLAGLPTAVVREVRAAGGTDDDLLKLGKAGGRALVRAFAYALVDGRYDIPDRVDTKPRVVIPDFIDLDVDTNTPIQMLVPRARLDQADLKIHAKRFPAPRLGIVRCRIHFLNFGKPVGEAEALAEMDSGRLPQGRLAPCGPHHLVAIATHHPDLQYAAAFVALGQRWEDPDAPDDGPQIVYLSSRKGPKRVMRMMSSRHQFYKSTRFPAVEIPG